MIVMVNEQVAVLPDASVAVFITVVVPFGNTEPEGGLLTTVTPGQLSLAVTIKVTTAVQRPGSVDLTIFAGQVIVGFSASLTVTVNEQLADVLPLASVA